MRKSWGWERVSGLSWGGGGVRRRGIQSLLFSFFTPHPLPWSPLLDPPGLDTEEGWDCFAHWFCFQFPSGRYMPSVAADAQILTLSWRCSAGSFGDTLQPTGAHCTPRASDALLASLLWLSLLPEIFLFPLLGLLVPGFCVFHFDKALPWLLS